MPNDLDIQPRRAPRQARSRATVDAILEATAQVLVELGYDKATTNVIAQRAGVSIGSLYQYFPNKEALVTALSDRHMARGLEMLQSEMQTFHDRPLRPAVRALVDGLLRLHADDPRLHRVLIEQVPRLAGFESVAQMDRMIVGVLTQELARRPEAIRPENLGLAAFVVVQSVQAVTHAAVLDRPANLRDEELAEEITELVVRYLVDGAHR